MKQRAGSSERLARLPKDKREKTQIKSETKQEKA